MTEKSIKVIIQKRENHGAEVAVLNLCALDNKALPEFSAGSHVDVQVSDDLLRQYSLSNSPNSPNYRIGVLNDPESRGGSQTIFENFQEGLEVTISEPRNHFEVEEHKGAAILVAGGIGITPLLSMAYELREQQRIFEIHYCLSKLGKGAFIEELRAKFPKELQLHCSDEKKFDPNAVFSQRNSDEHLYVCGPTGFMDWVIESAKQNNFTSSQIHFEYFNADVELSGEAFEVYCSLSDKTVQVADNQTIAGALVEAGVKVVVSCEQGVCGTCITDVLEGEPEHRDHFLTDEEKEDNDQMALCCSRAKSSRLVIEI